MKKFEYKTIKIDMEQKLWTAGFNLDETDRLLNELGQQGWELVSAQDVQSSGTSWYFHYTFKREII